MCEREEGENDFRNPSQITEKTYYSKGSVSERVRTVPNVVFLFLWATLVYDPAAYWTWANRGWIRNMSCIGSLYNGGTPCQLGSLDFAGGGPVHVASGFAGLAYCLLIGKRKNGKTT